MAKATVRFLLHQGGGLRDVRFWNRNAIRILMYHDFPGGPEADASLRQQLEHINRYYHAVTMSDIARCIREGEPLPPNAIAVTVDDGGRDFLLNASSIFKAYKVPATLYVVSGVLDKLAWFWWDQVEWLLKSATLTAVALPLRPERGTVALDLETPQKREDAIAIAKEIYKVMGQEERNEAILKLQQKLQTELPSEPPPQMSPLSWCEVKQLAAEGFEIGAHTVTHPDMAQISDPDVLKYELEHCKTRIEEELQRPVRHFCFPYGTFRHFTKASVKAVGAAGFDTAVTAEWGFNTFQANPYLLRRIPMEPLTPVHYFQECLAGVHRRKSCPQAEAAFRD